MPVTSSVLTAKSAGLPGTAAATTLITGLVPEGELTFLSLLRRMWGGVRPHLALSLAMALVTPLPQLLARVWLSVPARV